MVSDFPLLRSGWFAGLLAVLLWTGCTTVWIDVDFSRPPAISLPQIDTLGIVEFSVIPSSGTQGPEVESATCGQDLADELTQAIDEKAHFQLVERAELHRSIEELQLNLTDLFEDAEKARKLGHLVSADGLIIGRVRVYQYQEYTEKHPTFYWSYIDPIFFWTSRTEENEQSFVQTRFGEARVEATLKIVDTRTGSIFASRTYYEPSLDQTKAVNNPPRPIDEVALFRKSRLAIVNQYAEALSPFQEEVEIPFQSGADYLGLGRYLGLGVDQDMEIGIDFAEDRNWDKALDTFTTLQENRTAEKKGRALWNLALTQTCMERFAEARATLDQAWPLLPGENKNLSETLAWINEREKEMARLRSLTGPGEY